jgi:hypothetical protein
MLRADPVRSQRASSWDRTGANRDYLTIDPGATATLLEADGPGCVTHMYCGMVFPELNDYRDAILRCYWDGSETASVEVPLGDFFGIACARVRRFTSLLLTVNPGFGASHGLNAYFPMPFATGARMTLEQRGQAPLGGPIQAFWYHVDYELYEEPPRDGTLRFHARFAQELRTAPVGTIVDETHHPGVNLDGVENYVVLDTAGRGRMAGLLLEIDNLAGGWYGEGDDMVFVDGERWPPSIHGTGTEEIFGGGACPSTEYAGPYTGFHLVESPSYEGLTAMYRWYVHDPISFDRSLRWTLEHGHANNFANTYASVAYWYQEPQARNAAALPPPAELRPAFGVGYEEARDLLLKAAAQAREARRFEDFRRIAQAAEPYYEGRWSEAIKRARAVVAEIG